MFNNLLETKIVSVQFKNKDGCFCGKAYTYYCTIPVCVGDLIIAPTGGRSSVARVQNADVPAASVPKHLLPVLKTITERADEEDHHE